MIKVIAVQKGYYGEKIREPGEIFGIEKEEDFSDKWMAYPDKDQKRNDAAQRKAATDGADDGKGTDGVVIHTNDVVARGVMNNTDPTEEQLRTAAEAQAEADRAAAEKADTETTAILAAKAKAKPVTRTPKPRKAGKAK